MIPNMAFIALCPINVLVLRRGADLLECVGEAEVSVLAWEAGSIVWASGKPAI